MASGRMAEALTPAQFLDMASELVAAGFDDDFDVPELWSALADLPPDDAVVLYRFVDAHPPRSALVPGVHRFADEIWRLLRHLLGFHAGAMRGEELRAFAEHLFSAHSQAAVIAGYKYGVRRLLGEDADYDLRDYVCRTPFEQLDVLENSAHLCCASWMHKSAGNLSTQSHDEVWSSDAAEAIRQSILDGTYRYCNKVACRAIPGRTLTPKRKLLNDPWWKSVIENHTGKLDRGPRRVNLAYDRHCNLSCPSCRTSLVTSDDEARQRLDRITQRNIFPLLRMAKEALVTGSGDPFASRTFRKMLQWIDDTTCPELKIELMTNGMLFTEKEWAKFPNLKGKVSLAKVSMDGATKESHELLRRGSKWEVMMQNLPFIGRIRAAGEIDAYELVFVVQKENFREMGDFVDLAKRVGADRVYFERLTNWGTFSADDYEEKAVFSPSHPLHEEFLAAISDPRVRDPMVSVGSLGEFVFNEAKAA